MRDIYAHADLNLPVRYGRLALRAYKYQINTASFHESVVKYSKGRSPGL